jgi:tRNA-specific 2-thiouridylase
MVVNNFPIIEEINKKNVLVALSGGVDSSLSVAITQNSGAETNACFMKNWTPRSPEEGILTCPLSADENDARRLAASLKIPLRVISFENEYRKKVLEYFFNEYLLGRTPNPDVLCNSQIKFSLLLAYALNNDFDYLATGHYARRRLIDGHWHLLRGYDREKDQSYFIFRLTENQLSKVIFPIGDLKKDGVRKLANELNLITSQKKDSQGLCFVGNLSIKKLLQTRIKPQTGDIIDQSGKRIGQHDGAWYYTIGQRHNFGNQGGGLPYYVIGKKIEKNQLFVARSDEDQYLYKTDLIATEVMATAGAKLNFPLECTAKIRYRQPDQDCKVELTENNNWRVIFKQPQRAVTPGQFIVLYDSEVVLGGGVIIN